MIQAAAIKGKDGTVYTLPKPCRHADIFLIMPRGAESAQGFIDSEGNFLTREEAYHVAHKAGQIIFRDDVTPTPGTLYTEDLW